ncbi:MAG: hypothetical protein ABIG61_09200 [Planctomycetota bacterium]
MILSKKTTIIILAVTLASITALAAAVIVIRRPKAPDFTAKSPAQITEYLSSPKFRQLDPETRRTTARSAMREMMVSRAREYCSLSPDRRTDYLDEVIDSMESSRRQFESMRSEFRSRQADAQPQSPESQQQVRSPQPRPDAQQDSRSPRGTSRPNRNRFRSPEGRRARMEFVSAETRAQMSKYRQALRQRMTERGMTFGRPRPR